MLYCEEFGVLFLFSMFNGAVFTSSLYTVCFECTRTCIEQIPLSVVRQC